MIVFQIWESGTLDIIISRQALLCLSQHQEHVSISGLSASCFPAFLRFHSFRYPKQATAPGRRPPGSCFCSESLCLEQPSCPCRPRTLPQDGARPCGFPGPPARVRTPCWWAPVQAPASASPPLPVWHRLGLYLLEQSLAVNRSEVGSHRWTHTLAIFPAGDHR